MKRKLFIGDLRGQLGMLKRLLDKIQPSEGDNTIFLGNYVGPSLDSKACVEYVLKLKEEFPDRFYFLRGCYDWLFCSYIGSDSKWPYLSMWNQMGGNLAIGSYVASNGGVKVLMPDGRVARCSLPIPERHLRFLESLPLFYEDQDPPVVASHTGFPPAFKDACTEAAAFLGDGVGCSLDIQVPGKLSIFGHNPQKEPFVTPDLIGIDLGAGIGGRLCCFDTVAREFHITKLCIHG